MELADGSAEIRWLSPSSFVAIRRWPDSRPSPALAPAAVDFTPVENGGWVECRTRYLTVRVERSTFRLRVETNDGQLLLEAMAPPRRLAGGVAFEYNTRAGESGKGERFLGLGARTDASIAIRRRVTTARPLLVSTAGYGTFHRDGTSWDFDLGGVHRVLARGADRADFAFYYGPSPKEILEEHFLLQPLGHGRPRRFDVGPADRLPPEATLLRGETLRETASQAIHASLSGIHAPAFDLTPWEGRGKDRLARAQQFAMVMPFVAGSSGTLALDRARRMLTGYWSTYLEEARDRGLPMIHPLPMQFSEDPKTLEWAEEFLIGDELLAAPVLDGAETRRVYLPRGRWTHWGSNREFAGRQVVELAMPLADPPLFARNGSIVPIERPGLPMELHYFPNLGAEFFLWEPAEGASSQFHAAPATDFLRLEVESLTSRRYKWVVHHRGPAREVSGAKAEWRHDAGRNNLHVLMDGTPGESRVVNIAF